MKKALVSTVIGLVGGCSNPQDVLPPMMERVCPELCEEFAEVTDACSWLPPFGGLVLGTIEALDYSEIPFDDDSCVSLERALVVRFHVDELLWGEETDRDIDVHFGSNQFACWSAAPRIDEDGSIDWSVAEDASTGPLVVGQRLGLHVGRADGYFVSDKTVALLADGTLRLSTGACDNVLDPYPSRSALDEELQGCSGSVEGSLPSTMGAATCLDGNP